MVDLVHCLKNLLFFFYYSILRSLIICCLFFWRYIYFFFIVFLYQILHFLFQFQLFLNYFVVIFFILLQFYYHSNHQLLLLFFELLFLNQFSSGSAADFLVWSIIFWLQLVLKFLLVFSPMLFIFLPKDKNP